AKGPVWRARPPPSARCSSPPPAESREPPTHCLLHRAREFTAAEPRRLYARPDEPVAAQAERELLVPETRCTHRLCDACIAPSMGGSVRVAGELACDARRRSEQRFDHICRVVFEMCDAPISV